MSSPRRGKHHQPVAAWEALNAHPEPPPKHSDAADGRPAEFSDEALALAFADRHARDLRYVAAWSRWLVWDGRVWRLDRTLHAFGHARGICREAALHCNVREAVILGSAKTVAAVGPGPGFSRWPSFLERITGGDRDYQDFLQRMAGYALTGDTSEQALFFAIGRGANGKSVFLSTLAHVMGSYHQTASIETFTTSAVERHPTEVASLRGARLVTAVETEEGRRWSAARQSR